MMNQALASNTPTDWLTRDRLARICVVSFFFLVEVFLSWCFFALFDRTAKFDLLGLSRLLASGCLLLFVAMMIALIIIREQPRLQAPGSWPRITAVVGTNLVFFGV